MTYVEERAYYLNRLGMAEDTTYTLSDLITKAYWQQLNVALGGGAGSGAGLSASTIEQMIGADLTQHTIDFSHLGNHGDGSHTGANKVAVQKNGTLIGTRAIIDFVETANLTFAITDDAANSRVIVTPTASAGGTMAPDVHSEIVGFGGRVVINKLSDYIYFEKNSTIQSITVTGTPPDVGSAYCEIDVLKSGRTASTSILGIKPRLYGGMQNPSIVSIVPLTTAISQGERLQVKVLSTGGTGSEAQDVSVEIQYIEATSGYFTSFQNTGNGSGAIAAAVTAGNNASPDAWDSVTVQGTAALTFDSTYSYKSIAKVYKAVSPAGTVQDCYATKNITATSRLYFTQTFVIPVLPTTNSAKVLRLDISAGVPAFSINIGTTGLVIIRDASSTTIYTGTVAITAGQAFRIDGVWQGGPDGFVELYLTTDTTSVVFSDHLYILSANVGTTITLYSVGRLGTGASSTAQTLHFMGTMLSLNGISGTAA